MFYKKEIFSIHTQSFRNIIFENNSPISENLLLDSTRPNLDIILSAGVEVPDIVKYFLATLAIIGYYAFLLLHHSNGYPSDLNLGSALYLENSSSVLLTSSSSNITLHIT